jgi:hypothetical protein
MNGTTNAPRKFGEPIELREILTSNRAIRVLGEHALSLPKHHPARTTITNLVRRYTEGVVVEFDEPDEELGDPFTGFEDVMEEAA